MQYQRKPLVALAALTIFSCNISELSADKSSKVGKADSGLDSPLATQLKKNGYYLDFSRLNESTIPGDLKDEVAVFQIALQSGDEPVLGGQIESFEQGNCVVTNVPWATTVIPGGGDERTVAQRSALPPSTGAPTSLRLAPTIEEDPSSSSSCVDQRIEQFGPNRDSNFFSIVIKKSRIISLNIFANGYQSKIVTIDGSKAKFIVLNIDLGTTMEPCYFAEAKGVNDKSAENATSSSSPELRSPGSDSLPWTCGGVPGGGAPIPPSPLPEPIPEVCAAIYAPVCGLPKGPVCDPTAACPELAPAPTNFGNDCEMKIAGATLIHEGECTTAENPVGL